MQVNHLIPGPQRPINQIAVSRKIVVRHTFIALAVPSEKTEFFKEFSFVERTADPADFLHFVNPIGIVVVHDVEYVEKRTHNPKSLRRKYDVALPAKTNL